MVRNRPLHCVLYGLLLIFSAISVVTAETDIPAQYSEEEIQEYKVNFQRNAQVVLRTLDLWAKSWVYLNIENYLSCYSPDFKGKGFSTAKAWQNNRRKRFAAQKDIELSISELEVLATANNTFIVTFTQAYKSDTYSDKTRKEIRLKYIDEKWLITAEKVLKSL